MTAQRIALTGEPRPQMFERDSATEHDRRLTEAPRCSVVPRCLEGAARPVQRVLDSPVSQHDRPQPVGTRPIRSEAVRGARATMPTMGSSSPRAANVANARPPLKPLAAPLNPA